MLLFLQANNKTEKVQIFIVLDNLLMSLDNIISSQTVMGGVINLFLVCFIKLLW